MSRRTCSWPLNTRTARAVPSPSARSGSEARLSSQASVAVEDLKAERLLSLKQRYPHIHTTSTYRELLNAPEIDAIVISPPHPDP